MSGQKSKPGPNQTQATVAWPMSRQKLQLAGYRCQYERHCRLCEAMIEFWQTPAKKLIPLDRRPDDTFMPHHATCPRAAEFRKKRAADAAQKDLFG